jgi:NAD(P)-dependent dehydrogenase (short-subunit alcohol dehydrogenase family)
MALLLRLCVVLQLLSGLRALAMKRILVTGGNKGIGKAICEKLLTEWPDTFVLLGSRDAQRGEQAVQDIVKNLGGNCKDRLQLLVLDTSSSSSVKRAADSLDASTELYGIVNNAGVGTI